MPLPWGGVLPDFFAIFMMCCYHILKIVREKFVGAARAKEKTPESPAANKPRARETHAGCTSGVPASGGGDIIGGRRPLGQNFRESRRKQAPRRHQRLDP